MELGLTFQPLMLLCTERGARPQFLKLACLWRACSCTIIHPLLNFQLYNQCVSACALISDQSIIQKQPAIMWSPLRGMISAMLISIRLPSGNPTPFSPTSWSRGDSSLLTLASFCHSCVISLGFSTLRSTILNLKQNDLNTSLVLKI